MSSNNDTSNNQTDDCSICLSAFGLGSSHLTLSCGHKFHLQCLISNVQAQNKECPLCRAPVDNSLLNIIGNANQTSRPSSASNRINNHQSTPYIPPPEDPIDEAAIRELSERVRTAQQAAISSHAVNNTPLLTVTTTLEYGGQSSDQESNIYGLVTVKAPAIVLTTEGEELSSSHIPIDLVCVVDQSGSMGGEKIQLLRKTLSYITDQLNEYDRLAIVSFNTTAYDRSQGLKRMNQQNQLIMKQAIENDLRSDGGTFIGSGLHMGIQILNTRQIKNPLTALLLLTDGQDNKHHDYTQLLETLPENIQCHTFGYGADHTAGLLVQIAEQGHGGTFTYIDEQDAVGPAFAIALGGLFTCLAQKIRVNIQFNNEYKITNIHSDYPYESGPLPSSQITFKLNNLNADENRNLIFQLNVPKIQEQQNDIIGHVSITYVEPNNNNQTFQTEPVPFHLVRVPNLSHEHLQVNYTLDIQRNRVETANVLKLAMEEHDYEKSLAMLKAQVDKIQTSVSAQDPFCQNLIQDLQHHYPSEQEYRSSHHNAYRVHQTERGTYTPNSTTGTKQYQNTRQRLQAAHYKSRK